MLSTLFLECSSLSVVAYMGKFWFSKIGQSSIILKWSNLALHRVSHSTILMFNNIIVTAVLLVLKIDFPVSICGRIFHVSIYQKPDQILVWMGGLSFESLCINCIQGVFYNFRCLKLNCVKSFDPKLTKLSGITHW